MKYYFAYLIINKKQCKLSYLLQSHFSFIIHELVFLKSLSLLFEWVSWKYVPFSYIHFQLKTTLQHFLTTQIQILLKIKINIIISSRYEMCLHDKNLLNTGELKTLVKESWWMHDAIDSAIMSNAKSNITSSLFLSKALFYWPWFTFFFKKFILSNAIFKMFDLNNN